jgi:hypothetical protein
VFLIQRPLNLFQRHPMLWLTFLKLITSNSYTILHHRKLTSCSDVVGDQRFGGPSSSICRKQGSPKRLYTAATTHGVTIQKTATQNYYRISHVTNWRACDICNEHRHLWIPFQPQWCFSVLWIVELMNENAQNCSGVHPASYPTGNRGSFPGGKAAGAWSWPLTSI